MIMMIKTTATTEGPHARFLLDDDCEVGVDQCSCGNLKFIGHRTCKTCAVEDGRYQITIEPGQVPCPQCGDGREPRFILCTSCSKVEGLLNLDGTRRTDCPIDRCHCGREKRATFAQCTICWERERPARNMVITF